MKAFVRDAVVLLLGLVALIYLVFPTLGVFELIPDVIPIIGNLDEAGATVILVNALAYYGISLEMFGGRRGQEKQPTGRLVRRVVLPPDAAPPAAHEAPPREDRQVR